MPEIILFITTHVQKMKLKMQGLKKKEFCLRNNLPRYNDETELTQRYAWLSKFDLPKGHAKFQNHIDEFFAQK